MKTGDTSIDIILYDLCATEKNILSEVNVRHTNFKTDPFIRWRERSRHVQNNSYSVVNVKLSL